MIQINFYPESDKDEYVKAAEEYQNIWHEEGPKIVETIERYSGLTFKIKVINATTFDGMSFSVPMRLKSNYTYNQKEAVLIHELIHRILMDNNYWFPDEKNFNEECHKVIDLILFDIWTDLLGKKEAEKNKEIEISYGNPDYKKAWDWALSFNKEERTIKFQEMKKKYQKNI